MENNSNNNAGHPAPAQPVDKKKGNVMALLSYLGILILIPLLTDSKNDPFVKFHIKQGLVLLIADVIVWVIDSIPFFGWAVGWILSIALLVYIIIGIMNVMNGEEKELPWIGQYAKNFKF